MITTQPYEEWRQQREAEWADFAASLHEMDDRLWRECSDCDGDGVTECDQGHEHNCEPCNGLGKIRKTAPVSKAEYFKAVVAEIRDVCVWTRRDFLGEVGPFVREFRGYGHQQERSAA